MKVSCSQAEFVTAVDTSGDAKTGQYISEQLINAIEKIGVETVVQVRLQCSTVALCKRGCCVWLI